ncbi:MAG: hypothetical protein AAB975_00560, partial [Patescibacteria group bacterium]
MGMPGCYRRRIKLLCVGRDHKILYPSGGPRSVCVSLNHKDEHESPLFRSGAYSHASSKPNVWIGVFLCCLRQHLLGLHEAPDEPDELARNGGQRDVLGLPVCQRPITFMEALHALDRSLNTFRRLTLALLAEGRRRHGWFPVMLDALNQYAPASSVSGFGDAAVFLDCGGG